MLEPTSEINSPAKKSRPLRREKTPLRSVVEGGGESLMNEFLFPREKFLGDGRALEVFSERGRS
jgi:hypothetical protein